MSRTGDPALVRSLTLTRHLPPVPPSPDTTTLLVRTQDLHNTLLNIANPPAELLPLADDLAHTATALQRASQAPVPSYLRRENDHALHAIRANLDELERTMMLHGADLLRRGWTRTIPNLQFARSCERSSVRLVRDVRALSEVERRVSRASVVLGQADEREGQDVLTRLPLPVHMTRASRASRRWGTVVDAGIRDEERHGSQPLYGDRKTLRRADAREIQAGPVCQTRAEHEEEEGTEMIHIMATPAVLSLAADVPWSPKAMSVQHVEKSYFSPGPSSPVLSTRRLHFFDTKGGVMLQTLPFLGVFALSVAALALVGGSSSLVLGFFIASAVLCTIPLTVLLADVFFSKDAREVLGRWSASVLVVAFFFLGTSCLVIGIIGRSSSGGWLKVVEDKSMRTLAAVLMIAIGALEVICFGVAAVFFISRADGATNRGMGRD